MLPALVEEVLDRAPEGCTVTDVGSTKEWAAQLPERFLGGHPVCGREARGPAHATADLFDGATWFLTPTAGTDPERYRLVHGFVASLGAVPVAIDPEAHDRLVALTSHLPHALANLLVNQAGRGPDRGARPALCRRGLPARHDARRGRQPAGSGWTSSSTTPNSSPRRWPSTGGAWSSWSARSAPRDGGYLARWVAEASENRRRMLADAYPDPGALQRVTVHVPDRPGVLAGVTQALGAERINIEDFELHHFSPDRGGVLTMLVSGEGAAERAAALLEAQGYGVSISAVLE